MYSRSLILIRIQDGRLPNLSARVSRRKRLLKWVLLNLAAIVSEVETERRTMTNTRIRSKCTLQFFTSSVQLLYRHRNTWTKSLNAKSNYCLLNENSHVVFGSSVILMQFSKSRINNIATKSWQCASIYTVRYRSS